MRMKIAALALLASVLHAHAQTPDFYVLKDQSSPQKILQMGIFTTNGKSAPASVSSDGFGNPLSGAIGTTNPNGTALFVQGVTGGIAVPTTITGTLPAFAATPTVNLGTISGVATQATLAQVVTVLGSPLQAGGSVTIGGSLPSFASPQHVICDSGCSGSGGGGVSATFGGAIGTLGTPNGYKDSSGNFQPILGDTTFGQWVSIKQSVSLAVTGAFFQATQPVSAASLPLPAGAATQTTSAAILSAMGSPFQAGGSISNTSFGISGTLPAFAATPTFNIGTLNGAATATLQGTGNTSLASIDGKTPALGQALAAASVPVVLTAAQLSTLTPLSSVTVTQGTGTNLHMVCDSGCSSSSSPSFGSAFPATGTPIGMSQGGLLTAFTGTGGSLNANITNTVPVTLTSTTITGTVAATQSGTWNIGSITTLPALVAGSAIIGKVGIDQTTPGTTNLVAAGQTGTWNITNISGTVSLPTGAATSALQTTGNASLSTIATNTTGASTAANQTSIQSPVAFATATATKSDLIGAQFLTTQPTITNTQQGSLLVSARGELLVSPGISGFPVTLTSTTITGSVAVTNAGTFATQSSLTQGGSALSATNGIFANLLQGNAVLSSGNPLPVTVQNTNSNGSALSSASSPVVIASDQAAVATKAASAAFVAGSIADLTHGQGAMAASVPVAIASDQSAITVKGGGASGSAVVGNPNLVAGSDNTNARTLSTDTAGHINTNGAFNVTPTDCSGTVATGGTAVNAFAAQTTLHGFTILNDDTSEPLWISFTTTAAASTAGSYPLAPATATSFAGSSSFTSPPGFGTNHALSVVAATSAHKYSCTWW